MTAASSLRAGGFRSGTARIAWFALLAVGAFLALGSVYDLITDARQQLPTDHASTFTAVTGTTWQEAASVVHPTTPYISIMETGYAVYELLFAAVFLALVVIPLRRGERWAWWCCWLIVAALVLFAALFGTHDAANLYIAIGVAAIAALALLLARPRAQRM